jgi:peptidoglycan hydrolase-like protein with peptidoglycan-binding domain
MSNTDTETQSPVEASNASAALPGSGGASAAYGPGSTAAPAATSAPTSQPYSSMTTPTAVGVPNPKARPSLLGQDARTKDDYAGDDIVVQPAVKAGGPASIEYAITDYTTAKGMQPQALAQLDAAAEYAGQAGLARIVVVAGAGRGHKSHGIGTEWDLMGYNADGSKWTREQRVAVAAGARSAGATRFGFYEYGKSYPTADGRLHIGTMAKLRGGWTQTTATWGAGGATSGEASRRYTNAAEIAFRDSLYGKTEFDVAAYLTAPRTMTAEAQNAPGTVPYAGDPFGVADSKLAAATPTPPSRPVPASALAFAEAQPEAADPTRQVLSIDALSTDINGRGRILDRGSRGAAATEWQTFLSMHGFTDAAGRQLTVDGDFGRRTREATKAFQEWAQIEVDGKVGPETLSAALYTIDPSSSPMPGKVAYDDGAVATKRIIAPAEVDIPLPRLASREVDIAPRRRPERGTGVPNPPSNPRRGGEADLTEAEIDELTRVDARGNYVTAATRSAEQATRQRLSEARTKDDRFRPRARPADTRSQDDIMLIRSSEAVREFARGMGDSYSQIMQKSDEAAARVQRQIDDAEAQLRAREVTEEARKRIDDAMLRVNPTPVETVTDVYSFGRFAPMGRGGPGSTAATRKQAIADLRRRFEEAGIPASF